MRIATSTLYDQTIRRMATLNARADTLTTQISTGKMLTSAADGAAGWQRLAGLKQADADSGAFVANLKLAGGLLAQTDSTLASVETQLQRASELAIQAGNGTLDAAAREAIAVQLDGVVEDLLALANTTDARGTPLFGGGTGTTAFAKQADGSIAYVGEGSPGAIPIGDGVSVQATENGVAIFGGTGGATDIFATLKTLSAAVRAGGNVADPVASAKTGIAAAETQATTARASAGARAARVELETARVAESGVDRAEARSALEETDTAAAITELQKTMTILQATQASFSKLSALSLFDYLR